MHQLDSAGAGAVLGGGQAGGRCFWAGGGQAGGCDGPGKEWDWDVAASKALPLGCVALCPQFYALAPGEAPAVS